MVDRASPLRYDMNGVHDKASRFTPTRGLTEHLRGQVLAPRGSPTGAPGTTDYGAYIPGGETDTNIFLKINDTMYQRTVLWGKASLVRKDRSVVGRQAGGTVR